MFTDPIELYHLVKRAWSEETCCSGWAADNPCRNQCSVTALAVQRHLGGDIVKTRTKGGTHFYNRIGGVYWDLAADQFAEPIPYENLASDTEEALRDTTPEKLGILLANIERARAPAEVSDVAGHPRRADLPDPRHRRQGADGRRHPHLASGASSTRPTSAA